MSDFLKMDVFFVVSTIAVVAIAILLCLALFKVLKILRNVERVSEIVTEEGELMRGDISEFRAAVKKEGFKFVHLASLVRKRAQSFMSTGKK